MSADPISTDNVTGRSQAAAAIAYPENTAAVIDLVRQARSTGIPLYPISTGHNWGYGSRSPITAGNRLVDLSRMKRILNAERISPDNPVALIEPGVTQGQLADFLDRHCPELTFNVTGAGRDTSIIGNALERGVGYFGPRKDDLFALEIVTGRGEVLHTGFRRLGESSPLAHCHPYGLGPILDGLFFQGNFGIVTNACFRLLPRRPREVAVSLAVRHPRHLGEFLDELIRLKRDGLLTSITHVGNQARTRSTLAYGISDYMTGHCGYSPERAAVETDRALAVFAPGEWTSLSAVVGNAGQVRAAIGEIKSRMRRWAKLTVVSETLLELGFALSHALRLLPFARTRAAAIHAARPLHAMALGAPTDLPVLNLLWRAGRPGLPVDAFDRSGCGLLFINPALPPDGAVIARLIGELERIAAAHRHPLYATLNIETPLSAVGVLNLLFDRTDPEQTERAHGCADALLAHIRTRGLEPYRARADMMARIVGDDTYWRTLRRLKDSLDPDNIIAPGRYNLPG